MAGKHRAPPALGVSVLDHVMAILSERDTRYQQRFDAQTTAIAAAMAAAGSAADKTDVAIDKRLDLLNELRGNVATKDEVNALEKLVNVLTSRLERIEARGAGLNDGWKYLIGAVALVGSVIAIVVNLH
jgi:hypothetical protein